VFEKNFGVSRRSAFCEENVLFFLEEGFDDVVGCFASLSLEVVFVDDDVKSVLLVWKLLLNDIELLRGVNTFVK
jgi:hypothetical protein